MQLSLISLALTKVYGGAAPAFSPLSLFAASEVGAWYDPSDLTTLFQDSAGTTPVTADGQPVGKILDKSGRGNHATQATAASRPLYKTDGTYHWLQFDGVDDSLSTETIDFTSTDKMSVFAGLYKQSDAATAMLLELNAALLSGSFYITAPETAAPNFGFGLNMTGAVGVVASPFAATAKFVMCSAFDGSFVNSSNSIRVRINSALVSTTGGGNSGIGSFANAQLFIGRRNNTNLPFNGRIYSLIIRGALSSAQQITDTETWVNSKTGAY